MSSAALFDHLLKALLIPATLRFTPAGLRAGGTVSAYVHDVPIADILWRLRLKQLNTLENYLQEVAAATSLSSVTPECRDRILSAASQYQPLLSLVAAQSGAAHRQATQH